VCFEKWQGNSKVLKTLEAHGNLSFKTLSIAFPGRHVIPLKTPLFYWIKTTTTTCLSFLDCSKGADIFNESFFSKQAIRIL
jgi:hypothetical protein